MMAAGELEIVGTSEMNRDSSPPAKGRAVATFGLTPAQQIMLQSSHVNGQRVVVVPPEVARSLGIGGGAETEAALRIPEESGDVSVSVMDAEESGMIDPDQFLAMELASGKAEAVVDQDLTSLSWLHSKNFLKTPGVRLRRGEAELSRQSPTSDYLKELPEPPAAPANPGSPALGAANWNFAKTRRLPPHLPCYDPKVHVHFKPPFSFSCLIFMAIEDSPLKGMPVKDIYNWIQQHFPFYKTAPIGWKNSIRHNLSLNKCFKKVEKPTGAGKGSLWTVEPVFRPQLIQSLRRSPCVQETAVCRPWAAAAGRPSAQRPPAGTPERRRPGTGRGGRRRPAAEEPGPDPALFPLLSRRLLSGAEEPQAGPDRSPVTVVLQDRPRCVPVPAAPAQQPAAGATSRARPHLVVIRRSPEEEHTYARDSLPRLPTSPHRAPPPPSDDEAFSDDSVLSAQDTSGRAAGGLSPEEAGLRLVQEGAGLLLSLAGVPPSGGAARPRPPQAPRLGRVGPV